MDIRVPQSSMLCVVVQDGHSHHFQLDQKTKKIWPADKRSVGRRNAVPKFNSRII